MNLILECGSRRLGAVGKRAALTLSVAGFAVASAAAGAAPGIGWLIAARAVQGGFGALLVALLPVLATTTVRPEARGRAMGVVATLGPLGAVSGPALGGALLAVAGWPAIFLVNVPVALAVIAVGLRSLSSDGPLASPTAAWPPSSRCSAVPRRRRCSPSAWPRPGRPGCCSPCWPCRS